MTVHVIDEAKRCLQCKKPACMEGCPIHTPISAMNVFVKANQLNEAGGMLFQNNPLSVICSLVCDHEKQCEGHCVLGKKGMPVHISTIENYISDTYFDKMQIACMPFNGLHAAVIGSGPAGITIAFELTRLGYKVTIFEAKEKIGGVLQYGIPEYRLPKTILERYRTKLMEIGVKIRPNATIGGALEIGDLFRDGYKSIFIGTGVWRPKKLGIKGESLGNVHFGIDYLANPAVFDLGKNSIVIGMGNTAIDVARSALRHGVQNVTLYARGIHLAASTTEVEYARLDGAEFEFNKAPQEITEEGVFFKDVYRDSEGTITGYSDTTEFVKADSILICISQGPKNKIVQTTPGLTASDKGLIVTDEAGHTSCEGIFAAGDVVNGARTVVEAVAYSKRVASAMHEYMQRFL
jgi:glutamate synthase (NADPH) small chain